MVLDCRDLGRLTDFWARALSYRLLPSKEPYRVLGPRNGPGPELILQRVPEPKSGKNRMHLDMHVGDVEQGAARLITLGAQRLSREAVVEQGFRWYVMADPEGNEFCVIQRARSVARSQTVAGPRPPISAGGASSAPGHGGAV